MVLLIDYNHQSPFIGPIKVDQKCEKLPPLAHGGLEMKFTYSHQNCRKK